MQLAEGRRDATPQTCVECAPNDIPLAALAIELHQGELSDAECGQDGWQRQQRSFKTAHLQGGSILPCLGLGLDVGALREDVLAPGGPGVAEIVGTGHLAECRREAPLQCDRAATRQMVLQQVQPENDVVPRARLERHQLAPRTPELQVYGSDAQVAAKVGDPIVWPQALAQFCQAVLVLDLLVKSSLVADLVLAMAPDLDTLSGNLAFQCRARPEEGHQALLPKEPRAVFPKAPVELCLANSTSAAAAATADHAQCTRHRGLARPRGPRGRRRRARRAEADDRARVCRLVVPGSLLHGQVPHISRSSSHRHAGSLPLGGCIQTGGQGGRGARW
mmetsp:Transcript_22891/g.77983  ORF Transcript_22891/g.77983 Transcript_22891/m.77983 type:complete len:334 (-) Transcript_22891:262-1263(-)